MTIYINLTIKYMDPIIVEINIDAMVKYYHGIKRNSTPTRKQD